MNHDTYWLTVTNIALGVVAAAALVAVVRTAVAELFERRRYFRMADKGPEL